MTTTNEPASKTPNLEPPGAGLPTTELAVARVIFRVSRFFSNYEKAAKTLEDEERKILELVSACDESTGARRVLIERLPGMEDSSRYWSVYMVLDHLRIVNGGIAGTIALLIGGRAPHRPANTAAVKPTTDVTAQVIPEFVKSCADLKSASSVPERLKTSVKFAHPWFGPLDASGWHFMSGFHMRLHRRQIERILEASRA